MCTFHKPKLRSSLHFHFLLDHSKSSFGKHFIQVTMIYKVLSTNFSNIERMLYSAFIITSAYCSGM